MVAFTFSSEKIVMLMPLWSPPYWAKEKWSRELFGRYVHEIIIPYTTEKHNIVSCESV